MNLDNRAWLGRLLDAVSYAVAVTGVVVAVSGGISLLPGLDLRVVKGALFLVGWLTFGYATFALRPTPPWRGDDPAEPAKGEVVGARSETRFQAAVQRLPPARFQPLPVDDRLPAGVNMFLASLLMLGTSLAMEVVWGI